MSSGAPQTNQQGVLPSVKLVSLSAVTFVAGCLQLRSFPTPISTDYVLEPGSHNIKPSSDAWASCLSTNEQDKLEMERQKEV